MADLQDYLAKLLLIRSRLTLADNEIHKLSQEHLKITTELTGFARPDEVKERRLGEINVQASLYFQVLIVNLDNLREIREKYLQSFQNTKIQKIIAALKPCTDILDKNELTIRTWRNNISAHGEIQGDFFFGANDITPDQRESQYQIFLSTKCSCMFIHGLTENLVLEVVKAKEILKEKMSTDQSLPVSDYFKSIREAKKIQSQTIQNLKDMYLNREIPFVGSDEEPQFSS